MLVLSRRRDESFVIRDDITVTVLGIRGNVVRLGISAPAHVAVHRSEIYAAIQATPPETRHTDDLENPR